MEEDTQPAGGSLLLAEICEPFRRPLGQESSNGRRKSAGSGASGQSNLHYCLHNWSRKGHATSLSRGPPRSGTRETMPLVATNKCNWHWNDGKIVKRKIHSRGRKVAVGNQQQEQQQQQQQQQQTQDDR